MPLPSYVETVRAKVGNDLLMLSSASVMLFDDKKRLLLAQNADSAFG
jgi:hypothetical protein